jgi:hypothetical protein
MGVEEKMPLYACRAPAGEGVHPGRFRSDFDGCHIGFAGQEISVMPFEVLASAWQDGREGSVPRRSFLSGERVFIGPQRSFLLTPLYPCRASFQGTLQVGEVAEGDKGCSFGFAGRQVTEPQYQVLWASSWLTWVPALPHQIPYDTLPAGSEGAEIFFICRAADEHGLHSGKIKQSGPGCSISSDGKEVVATEFSVLGSHWSSGVGGTLPAAPLPTGYEGQALLFLCRAQVGGAVQIGKTDEELAACHIGMMGGETANRAYDVLSAR